MRSPQLAATIEIMRQNVFVLGLNDANRDVLHALPGSEQITFHQLLTQEELQEGEVDVLELLARAQEQLDAFDGSIDAIVNFWDFPATMMLPVLCQRRGLPSADLLAVLRCEHKYWSRLVQSRVTEALPAFGLLDLDAEQPHLPAGVSYPVWIKPVESASSEGAYRIEDDDQLAEALPRAREEALRMGRPFEAFLEQLELPPEIEQVGGAAYMVEEVAHGQQMTVEGFVADGEVHSYGLVASHTYPDSPSFLRYQYPAAVPDAVADRIAEVSRAVIEATGLNSSTFNIEFFWDPQTDRLRLLEVNARHSQEHARLFDMVDGVANHAAMLRLGLGLVPDPPQRAGRYPVAAKWFLRHFSDGVVRSVPDQRALAELEEQLGGAAIRVLTTEGERLSASYGEDSYSYVLAELFIGGQDEEDLLAKYEQFRTRATFDIEDIEED